MLVQKPYNRKITEYNRYDDILEDKILPDKLNSTTLERRLMLVNTGNKRRLRNNHAERLQAFKNK